MNWNAELNAAVAQVCGPEDEPDESVNGDPESMHGEDDEEGFDDMPLAAGWEDEGGEDDESEDDDEE